MLDLDAPLRRITSGSVAVDLAVDADDPLTFYVQPGAPRVSVIDGKPALQLLRIKTDAVQGDLELQVELVLPTPAVLDDVRAQLQALRNDKQVVKVVVLPVIGATAELMFVGSETTADGTKTAPLARVYSQVQPILDPPFTARFSVPLDAGQTALVAAALQSGAAPVGVIVRLQVEGLRPAQRIVAHVDWNRVYKTLSSDIKDGFLVSTDDVQKQTQSLVDSQAIRIDVIQAAIPDGATGAAPPDPTATLAWIEREIVETCCKPVLPLDMAPAQASLGPIGDMFGVGAAYVLKNITEIEHDSADIDLSTRTVAVRTLACSAHLEDLLGGAPAASFISDVSVDMPFFQTIDLHISTAKPLAASFVKQLVAHFHYGQTTEEISLDAQTADGQVRAYADQQPDHTWSVGFDVVIADDAPVDPSKQLTLPAITGKARELTLDVDHLLGLYSIQVLGAPDPRVVASRVDFDVQRAGQSIGNPSGATVTTAAPQATAWFRDIRPGDAIYASVKHMLADGRLIQLAKSVVDTRILRLPPAFPGAMTILLFADDDWSELDHVAVSLQKSATAPAVTVSLASAGASASVSLDLPDPTDRTYRYRSARTLKSGDVEQDDWVQTDSSALLIGRVAANMLDVEVTPTGVELPAAGINTIEVQLQYIDAPNLVRSTPTAVIHALADTYHWTVPLKNPQVRSYQYRVIVHRVDGTDQTGNWTTASDHILLIPVAAPAGAS